MSARVFETGRVYWIRGIDGSPGGRARFIGADERRRMAVISWEGGYGARCGELERVVEGRIVDPDEQTAAERLVDILVGVDAVGLSVESIAYALVENEEIRRILRKEWGDDE